MRNAECGITVLAAMAHKPLIASNITVGALFRAIGICRPTLFIDEADTFLAGNGTMRGIINSGNTWRTAYVVRLGRGRPIRTPLPTPASQPTGRESGGETGLTRHVPRAEIEARMQEIQRRWQLCDEANAEIEKERAQREAARAAERKAP
jgi:hypothetical protein